MTQTNHVGLVLIKVTRELHRRFIIGLVSNMSTSEYNIDVFTSLLDSIEFPYTILPNLSIMTLSLAPFCLRSVPPPFLESK